MAGTASILTILLTFCFLSAPNRAQAAAITIKVANWFPISHQQDITLRAYSKELEKRAGGKLKVKYYAAQTLVPSAQSYDAVVKGISDIGNHVLGYTMGRFPFTQILDFPIGYPSGPEATIIANEFYRNFRPTEFDDEGTVFSRSAWRVSPYEDQTRHQARRRERTQIKVLRVECKVCQFDRCSTRGNADARSLPDALHKDDQWTHVQLRGIAWV